MSASIASASAEVRVAEEGASTPLPSRQSRVLLEKLRAGSPPPPGLALATLAGFDRTLAEWTADLDRYVCHGGSLLRVLHGRIGTGKTHLARALQELAAQRRFLVCQVDAAAQHTDDDLALLEAFSDGLTDPDAVFEDEAEKGLRSILERVADDVDATTLKSRLREVRVPVAAVANVLPDIVSALARDRRTEAAENDILLTVALMSGHPIRLEGRPPVITRSVARLAKAFPGPLLRKLSRAPGKRDARLWLESLLKVVPALGYSGVLWILDEHDEANRQVMKRHIVQLRRLADRLAEGRLPGALVVYLVLDDFPARMKEEHAALDQRLRPVLRGAVNRRVMLPVADLRDVDSVEFLQRVAGRVHSLVRGGPMSSATEATARSLAARFSHLGGVDTRGFVQAFSAHLTEEP